MYCVHFIADWTIDDELPCLWHVMPVAELIWIATAGSQFFTQQDAIDLVQLQQSHRCTSCCGNRCNIGAVMLEMLVPIIRPGVEESDNLVGDWIL